MEHWRARLSGVRGLRVGIHWQGRLAAGSHRLRNIPLEHFECLAALPNVKLVSLQQGAIDAETARIRERLAIVDFGAELDAAHGAFLDTAAIMKNLDLVVTNDTSVAHLAGALGVAVWVALPFVPDWRWMLNRSESPWYPTMRLFRQESPGDWGAVLRKIAAQLAQRL
jgi:hypothetical protein